MPSDLNTVSLVARLTRDPDLRQLAGGNAVCNLRVAFSTRKKDGEAWVDASNYVSVTAFGRTAENAAKFLTKGRQVAITGRLSWREYEKDGQRREILEIVANDIQFIGGRDEQPSGLPPATSSGWAGGGGQAPVDQGDFGGPQQKAPEPVAAGADDQSDLPF